MFMSIVIVFACLVWQTAASLGMCLDSTSGLLDAGHSVVSATIDVPEGTRCEASLQFSNSSFLPIHYTFSSVACPGQQLLAFTPPGGVPNGEADIVWQCAGLTPHCMHATIANGTGDMTLTQQQQGKAGCVVESFKTETLVSTQGTGTALATKTLTTVVTIRSTSFPETTGATTDSTKPVRSPDQTTTTTKTADRIPDFSHTELTKSTPLQSMKTLTTTTPATPGASSSQQNSASTIAPARKKTDDSPFVSTGTKMSAPVTRTVTATLVSTLTILGTYCSA